MALVEDYYWCDNCDGRVYIQEMGDIWLWVCNRCNRCEETKPSKFQRPFRWVRLVEAPRGKWINYVDALP